MRRCLRNCLYALACCCLSAACAVESGSDDPRQRGLFGYNPKGYERRIQERETRLTANRSENTAALEEGTRLEASTAAEGRKKTAAQQRLQTMNGQLAEIERTLGAVKAEDARDRHALEYLRARRSRLSGRLGVLEEREESPATRAESERLGMEIQRLAREAEALGAL